MQMECKTFAGADERALENEVNQWLGQDETFDIIIDHCTATTILDKFTSKPWHTIIVFYHYA